MSRSRTPSTIWEENTTSRDGPTKGAERTIKWRDQGNVGASEKKQGNKRKHYIFLASSRVGMHPKNKTTGEIAMSCMYSYVFDNQADADRGQKPKKMMRIKDAPCPLPPYLSRISCSKRGNRKTTTY